MNSSKSILVFAANVSVLLFASICVGQEKTGNMVYFGNGIRNGWVDQTSAVIWTRATKNPEGNAGGKKFLVPKGPERKKAQNSNDPEQQLKVQIPEGATLEDMEGACPGIEAKISLAYAAVIDSKLQYLKPKLAEAENDFAVQWRLENLKPDTRYRVEVSIADGSDSSRRSIGYFKTPPKKTTRKDDIRFCLTTCHDYPRRDDPERGHLIYPSMTRLRPDFMVHAGDIEYYDKPAPFAWSIPLMRFHWNRFFALPANRMFYRNHTTYFMKDDHDTLKNDCWRGQKYGSVTFEQGVKLFNEEQFPANDKPYKTVRWGRDLQIWMVEGRDYRSPNNMPDGPDKTIWGKQQKQWFFDTVSKSDATFKILFSPTPILGPDRSGKRDNHANKNFQHEGDELRKFIGKQKNFLIMCGDRHWQYASHMKEPRLWEFGCGPGSKRHELGWKKGDVREQHEFLRVAGGFLSGELKSVGDKVSLTVRHRKVDGTVVNEIRFEDETKK